MNRPATARLVPLLFLLIWSHSGATTINVPDDQPTIQAGIGAAAYGDTVMVACGTYYEHDIVMKSGVLLTSETGLPDCVTIDAQNLGRVLYCEDLDAASLIRGFRLEHGQSDRGGGLYCRNSSPQVRDCSFVGNAASLVGGGVFAWGTPSPSFIDCAFEDNTAYAQGGGMACLGGSPVVTRCVFIENRGETGGTGGHGGGLHCMDGSTALVEDCLFEGNSGRFGGGMNFWSSSPTIMGTTFLGNSATNGGGGLYSSYSSATVMDCSFSANSSGPGGGMACHESNDALMHVSFTGNTAVSGGGLFCTQSSAVSLAEVLFSANTAENGGGIYALSSQCDLRNTTLVGNSASLEGGGIYVKWSASVVTLDNTLIASSGEGEAVHCHGTGAEATLTCCDIYGNAGGDWVGCIADQYEANGNFSEDPLFCFEGNPDEPYSLHDGSPCLPDNSPCGQLVGAYPQGCEALTPVGDASWGEIKAMFRQRRSRASTGSQR